MDTPNRNTSFHVQLFDLLLVQFGGSEGELPMAIAYLTQATGETNAMRKAALVRIAREKIRHAEILGSMLVQMSRGGTGPLSTSVNRSELNDLLLNQEVASGYLDRAASSLQSFIDAETTGAQDRHFAPDPRVYLAANIVTEDKQIAAYEQLAALAADTDFVSALNYAKSRQQQHRNEFVDLLRRASH